MQQGRYFIVRNVYSILQYREPFSTYHIIRAENWSDVTDMIEKHKIYHNDTTPVRSEVVGEGTKESMQELFFPGTEVHYEDEKGKLQVEYL